MKLSVLFVKTLSDNLVILYDNCADQRVRGGITGALFRKIDGKPHIFFVHRRYSFPQSKCMKEHGD